MTRFSGRSIALLIQATDAEVRRLRALPDEQTVSEDEEKLVAFENLADELAEAYDVALENESGLQPYEQLVQPQP
jgi:hypothetical protein